MTGLAQTDELRLVDGIAIAGECGLYIDVALGDAVHEGDWIATDAGSRYLVMRSRKVRRRKHAQNTRYQLRVGRLQHGQPVPDDVTCWRLTWYRRPRHAR